MKSIYSYIMGAGIGLMGLMSGCASDEGLDETPQVMFHVTTRAEGDAEPDAKPQWQRLFVAERLSEHASVDGEETLHCGLENRHDLTGNHYKLEGLLEQWYKFAFFSVPNVDEATMGIHLFEAFDTRDNDTEHDFNRLLVNYNAVMHYQSQQLQQAQQQDLSIYRKNIDRWVDAKNPTSEDVELERVTGLLVLDMGIPADQFERPVEQISLQLANEVQRIYLRDNARGDVIGDVTVPTGHTFYWPVAADSLVQNSRQQFQIMLLPQKLAGAKVTVDFADSDIAFTYALKGESDKTIEVKKNRRTLVRFNGLHTDEFEVRYAGFDNRADIDVDGDNWDGWQ